MPLCLLLALALLGTASARHLAPASPEAMESALEVPKDDTQCPLESETRKFTVTHPLGVRTYRYTLVNRCETFAAAQRTCAKCYGGRLASIHSYRINLQLQHQAQHCLSNGQFWIGAITQLVHGHNTWCHWADQTTWNYSNWASGFPLYNHRYCTTLCTNSGHWRSLQCQQQRPFICEY